MTVRTLPPTARAFLVLGALAALLAVAFGAFGAHALKARLDAASMSTWHTGVEYHLFHAAGLLATGILGLHFPQSGALRWSGWLMAAGVVLFSGSLYALALTGDASFALATPVGGLAFLAAWAALIVAISRA
jgi:uncharacterized membrane protein YgdD (TMEM256/DUF423 family)